ncbi:MAG: 16S rRNA (guanine(527)-N(7))-methyltransferase RsmG [Cyanobacteria bacterium SID2]|nr:16S rRNA (guanine(527)-N(7))-methyltransferase RsmG [Cyanobacteria bacterium SID2]MBP0005086.1 16S rRNA (guanine(527)-N(7))-methyltransferase RsmG [Cyanobacteria bacterium SBC]
MEEKGNGKLKTGEKTDAPTGVPTLPDRAALWRETLALAELSSLQREQLQRLYEGILLGNRQLNLTRITEPEDFWEKHLWDSLRGVVAFSRRADFELPQSCRVVDVGTGAGFPGIPLSILHPTWQVTLLDSTQKKIRFLKDLITELGLANVTAVTGRAERLGQISPYRGSCDLAVVRAVGATSACARYTLPWLKVGGWAVLYRGRWTEEEREELEKTLVDLRGTLVDVERFETPLTQSVRHCIYLRRTS